MSVLQLRRDMVVIEDPVVEDIDTPFPLRTIDVTPSAIDAYESDLYSRKSFGQHVRGWFIFLVILAALGAYPSLIVASSDVGDRNLSGLIDRTQWTAPWAGGAATLMERHYGELGWAPDAAAWTPMARLSAKPALQRALAESLGEYLALMSQREAAEGAPDADLLAASRLVTLMSTGVQMRAAHDALVNYDRRERRHGAVPDVDPVHIAAQLRVLETWAGKSQTEITRTTALSSGPLDASATHAVYAAKGRAQAAYVLLETMNWPDDPKVITARGVALVAWKAAAEFHPLIVLNGATDGSIFGNHAASMGFLISQAEKATEDYLAAIQTVKASTAQPAALANSGDASLFR